VIVLPNNYVLLETIALTQSAASVTFDNLPTSGYTDLKVVFSLRSSRTPSTDGAHIALTFNGNTSSVYTFKHIRGNGSAASSYGESNATSINLYSQADSSADTANTFSNNEIYIPNYAGATNKSISVDSVYENNATTAGQHLVAGLFASTAAITSIRLAEGFGFNWVAGSTFSLYGIAALGTTPVLAPKATGGNSIENDGTYWIHTFTSSGTFTPQVGLTCDYLVVAGGGAGGSFRGGGGGAGGYRTSVGTSGRGASAESALSLASGTSIAVTVGAGGAKVSTDTPSNPGNNSIFSTITSTGGGAGGNASGSAGNGGAGGGAQGNNVTSGTHTAGLGTTAQGYDGGTASGSVSPFGGGGGGGAGAAGGNASGAAAAGGAGITSSISSLSTTYGVGGTGGATAAGNGDGTASLGNGGGGGGDTSGSNGNGGSGIVIVRYPIN